MSEIASLQKYKLDEGVEIEYDPANHLPPDSFSDKLGRMSALALVFERYLNQAHERPSRLLIPGIGTGILACNVMVGLNYAHAKTRYAGSPLHIDAFDINPSSVETAAKNIKAVSQQLGQSAIEFSFNIFEADWNDKELWQQLSKNPYHHVVANPPYLPSNEDGQRREYYKQAPKNTMFTPGDQYEPYRTLMRHMPEVLSSELGSGLLFRLPVRPFDWQVIEDLVTQHFDKQEIAYDISAAECVFGHGPWGPIRWGRYVALTRANDYIRSTAELFFRGAATTSLEFADVLQGKLLNQHQCFEIDVNTNKRHGTFPGSRQAAATLMSRYDDFKLIHPNRRPQTLGNLNDAEIQEIWRWLSPNATLDTNDRKSI